MEEGLGVVPARLFLATILGGALVYAAFISVTYLMAFRRRRQFISKIPTTKCNWLLGHMLEFPGPGEEGLTFMKEKSKEFPSGYGIIWYGPIPSFSTFHPESAKHILRTSEPKARQFVSYSSLLSWLGDGLLLAGGQKWARNRRLLTPAFHFDILRPYMAVNNRATDIFLSKLEKFAETGEYFEVFNHVSMLTLDIILRCAFSYDIDCQRQGESNPYVNAITSLGEAVTHRMISPWLYPEIIFYLSPTGREFRKNCDIVHKVSEEIIQKRKETLKTQGIESTKKSRYLDFLDVLLTAKDDSGSGLSDREIRDEVDTFLFEGHDTTASGVSWAMYSLAKHPEHQERCQQEIDEVLAGKENKDIEWEDLPKLNYLTMCIKESLRMSPPVPVIQRQTTKDLDIEGHKVPAGTLVDIHLYVLQHNPQIWDNPEEFRPERFHPENLTDTHSYAFVPFSAGPRNCIGQHFAMHELKTIMAKTLSRFTLSLDPAREAKHRIVVILKTEEGMYMKATPRIPSRTTKPR